MSAAVPALAEPAGHQTIKAIVAASSGNLVEWHVLVAFISIYFAATFFRSSSPTGQLLATAGIFVMGFFMRLLGGGIFGRLANRRGSKFSLAASVRDLRLHREARRP